MTNLHNRMITSLTLLVLAGAFLFFGCKQEEEEKDSDFKVTIGQTVNGNITADPMKGPAGTEISVSVSANQGYKYVVGSLKYNNTLINDSGSQPYTFTLTENVTLTAEFTALALGEHSVTIGTLTNGTITAEPAYGTAGTLITLTITPSQGYLVKPGTLTYTPEGGSPVPITGNTFTMPAKHVTINATFEVGNLNSFLDTGITALEDGDYDTAIYSFDSAYALNNTNQEAIVYSTLGRLAAIAVDDNVKKLMTDRLGIKSYPGTINGLISPNWMEEYTDEELVWWYYDGNNWVDWYDKDDDWWFFNNNPGLTPKSGYYRYNNQQNKYVLVSETPRYEIYTSSLPGLNAPSWFTDTDFYKDSLTTDRLKSTTTFSMLLFANLIEKNPSGLNTLFDDLLSSVLGTKFEEAYTRAGTLTGTVKIKESTLETFGLTDIFEGGDVEIGKAELNILFAALRVVKASLEWVSAYDWNTDLTFFKNGQLWDDWDKLGANKPASLPLRNNFLKDRNNGRMDLSKADLIKAIDDSIEAYGIWIGANSKLPQGYKDTLNDYKWIQDGFGKLKTAITGGSNFYVKIYDSGVTTYNNNNAQDAEFGINMGKLFTPGQLAIDKLIDYTGSGTTIAPKFYGCYEDNYGDWVGTEITAKSNLQSGYEGIGFKINMTPIKEIIILGMEDVSNFEYMSIFSPDFAGQIWDWYH